LLLNQNKQTFYLFLLGIFILNLLQAIFTAVLGDETCYWLFSQHLDWGFFDHPPMVALLVKGSDFLLNHNLSIRFFTVVLSILTPCLLWQLIPAQNKNHPYSITLFFLLLLASPGFHIYGFITTPDVPLLFFFALYWWAFEKFHIHNLWKHAFLVGIAAALLLYSKYHGGIIILLSVLFRWQLLKNWKIYFVGFIALILILPHLYWQYQHDFVTFNYFLFQRTDGLFRFQNVVNYLWSTIGILNPALLLVVIVLAVKRQLNWTFSTKMILGILGFFFLYSFRGKVDAHWVVAAFIPMVLVLHDYAIRNQKAIKSLKIVALISIVILLMVRLLLVIPMPIHSEFHTQKTDYFKAIEQAAEGKKVVFVNSYQKASKYQFYTGQPSFSYDNDWYRKTQYDLESFSETFHNQTVYLVGDYPSPFFDSIFTSNGEAFLGAVIPNFPILTQLNAEIETGLPTLFRDSIISFSLNLKNLHSYPIDFENSEMPIKMFLLLMEKDNRFYLKLNQNLTSIPAKSTTTFESIIDTHSIPAGKYEAWLVVQPGDLYFQKISKKYKLEVE
jgi:hypothetical protein